MQRRLLLTSLALGALVPPRLLARSPVAPQTLQTLRAGGVAVLFRHALAPGTFDPPGFRVDECSTQRNLNDEGREQARRIGAWFREQGLVPAAVRSSQWCRCLDTARLAFGEVQPWPALNSFIRDRAQADAQLAQMRAALAAIPAGRFEAWVTHQVNMSGLTGAYPSSGEGFVVRTQRDGSVAVLDRLMLF